MLELASPGVTNMARREKLLSLPVEFQKRRKPKKPPLPVADPETGLTPAEAAILEEYLKRQPYDPLDGLFDLQLRFINDPNDRKSLLCSRRSGKTYACLRYMIKECLAEPDVVSVYIGLDRKSAKKNVWKEIQKLVRNEKRLKVTLNQTDLVVSFENGSELWVTGATDEADIEKLRGNKYVLVVIDECASFPESLLAKLIRDVIEPALIDYGGTLVLAGTPGNRYTDDTGGVDKAGPFYAATTFDKEWSQYKWTLVDNPTLRQDPKTVLEKVLRRNRWTAESPQFRREYLGEWVRSVEEAVYKYSEAKSDYEALPKRDDWVYLLSLDVGTRDQTAFVLSCFSEKHPNWYILEAYGKAGMAPDDIAKKIKAYKQLYPIERVIMDCGGLGLAIAEHFRKTHHLAITPAEKKEKFAFIEFFNGDMLAGKVKVKAHSPDTISLIEQWRTLTIDPANGKEDKHAQNDLCDAALYGYRHARAYLYKGEEKPPPPVTPDDEMKKFWDQLARDTQQAAAEPFAYLEEW